MTKGRLEAFSDGVLAIIITIMVLELKVPHDASLASLVELFPILISYILSFIFVGIYWNNHHHLFHAVSKVSGSVLWANLHLLFWLSLIPFASAWMGENHFSSLPVALYGINLLLCGVAYYILAQVLIFVHGKNSILAKAIGSDFKGLMSLVIYAVAIPFAFFNSVISALLYVTVALMWLIPDRRIEKNLIDSTK